MKRAWRNWSIRTRLGVAHAASLSVVLLAFAAASYLLLWNQLTDGVRRELGREFEVIESLIDVSSEGQGRWLGDDFQDEAEYEGGPIAAEVWTLPGQLLVRTRAATRWAGDTKEPILDWASEGFDFARIRDERVLILQGRHLVAGHSFLIRVFRSTRPVSETMTAFSGALLVAFLAALAVALTTSRRLVSRLFLRPLSDMAERAARISAERPGERLPIENPEDELGQLGIVINGTLARFDEVASRLRRFTADASHELRTPLTSIRTVGEISLRETQSDDTYRDVIGSILEEVEALTRLLDSLLLLSRADEAKEELRQETLPILEVVRKVEEVMSVLAERRDQTIRIHGDPRLLANIDETVLRLALINLLDNAIKHGPSDGTIDVVISRCDDEIRIDIHDEGDGISPEHRDRIFDRFYRVDSGRSRAAGGSGLGLSVARWAVEAHGGSLQVEDDGREGTTFRIRIPQARAA